MRISAIEDDGLAALATQVQCVVLNVRVCVCVCVCVCVRVYIHYTLDPKNETLNTKH